MEVDDLLARTAKYDKEKALAIPVSKKADEAAFKEAAFKQAQLYKNMKAQAEEDKRELAKLRSQVKELRAERENAAVSAESICYKLWEEQKARGVRLEKLLKAAGEHGHTEKARADKAERQVESLSAERAYLGESIERQTGPRVKELENKLAEFEEELNNMPRKVENDDRPIATPRGKCGQHKNAFEEQTAIPILRVVGQRIQVRST